MTLDDCVIATTILRRATQKIMACTLTMSLRLVSTTERRIVIRKIDTVPRPSLIAVDDVVVVLQTPELDRASPAPVIAVDPRLEQEVEARDAVPRVDDVLGAVAPVEFAAIDPLSIC